LQEEIVADALVAGTLHIVLFFKRNLVRVHGGALRDGLLQSVVWLVVLRRHVSLSLVIEDAGLQGGVLALTRLGGS